MKECVLICVLGLVSLAFGASQESMSLAERPGHKVLFPLIQPAPVLNEKTFQDRFIRIEFLIITRLAFRLDNVSTDSIEIDWDRSSYVDPLGGTHRVIHKGVRFMERDRPQAPTMLPTGSSLEDVVIPVDYVEYTDGQWRYREPFRLSEITKPGGLYQGRTFRVILALKIGATGKPYDFTFKIPEDLKRPN